MATSSGTCYMICSYNLYLNVYQPQCTQAIQQSLEPTRAEKAKIMREMNRRKKEAASASGAKKKNIDCLMLQACIGGCYPTTFCKFSQPSAAFGSVRSLNYRDQNMSCHLIFAKSNTVRYNNPARQLIIALHSHLTMHHCCGGSPQIAEQDTPCCWLPTI